MRFLWTAFWMHCKRIFGRGGVWVVLVLLLLSSMGTALYVGRDNPVVVRVGVIMDQQSKVAWGVVNALEKNNSLQLEVGEYPHLEQYIEVVEKGEMECVYVLAQDFDARIEAGDLWGIVTLIHSPGSVVYPLVNEAVYGAVFESCASLLAADVLAGILEVDAAGLLEELETRMDGYGDGGQPVLPDSGYSQGKEAAHQGEGRRIVHGVMALLLLTLVMLILPALIEEKEAVFIQLVLKKQYIYSLSLFLALFVLGLVAGALFLLTAGLVNFTVLYPAGHELAALALYACSLGAMGTAIFILGKDGNLLNTAFIFIFLIVLVAGGVFFDPMEVGKAYALWTGVVWTNSYLRLLSSNNFQSSMPMAAAALLSLAAGILRLWAADRKRNGYGLLHFKK